MIHWCDSDWSLTQLLHALGYAHAPRDAFGDREVIDETGEAVFVGGYDCTLVWLADVGQIADHPNIAWRRQREEVAA